MYSYKLLTIIPSFFRIALIADTIVLWFSTCKFCLINSNGFLTSTAKHSPTVLAAILTYFKYFSSVKSVKL